jgi:hypothetical protein
VLALQAGHRFLQQLVVVAGEVVVAIDTTTEVNCRGGSRASIGAAAPASLPRVFLQRVPL